MQLQSYLSSQSNPAMAELGLWIKRKRQKYEKLINEQQNNYEKVKFVNMS